MIILKRFYSYIGYFREIALRFFVMIGRAVARIFFFSPKEVIKKYPLPMSEEYQKWPMRIKNDELSNCQSCHQCMKACPSQAISSEDGDLLLTHELCLRCGVCAEVCPEKIIVLQQLDVDCLRPALQSRQTSL